MNQKKRAARPQQQQPVRQSNQQQQQAGSNDFQPKDGTASQQAEKEGKSNSKGEH